MGRGAANGACNTTRWPRRAPIRRNGPQASTRLPRSCERWPIVAAWIVDGAQLGAAQTPTPDGTVTGTIPQPVLGPSLVNLTATLPGYEPGAAGVQITVCDQKVLTFDTELPPSAWKINGDAHWDAGGGSS